MTRLLLVTHLGTRDIERVLEGIQTYEHLVLGERPPRTSTYFVYTDVSPSKVRDHLWQLAQPTDVIFVAPVTSPAACVGFDDETQAWVRARIPAEPSDTQI